MLERNLLISMGWLFVNPSIVNPFDALTLFTLLLVLLASIIPQPKNNFVCKIFFSSRKFLWLGLALAYLQIFSNVINSSNENL